MAANPHRESFVISKEQPYRIIACKAGDMFKVTDGNNSYVVTIPETTYKAIYLLPQRYIDHKVLSDSDSIDETY